MERGKIVINKSSSIPENMISGADKDFEIFVPEMLAIKKEDITRVHLKVDDAIRMGLLASRNLRPYATTLAELPGYSVEDVTRLDGVSRALYSAVGKRRRTLEETSRFTELTQVGYAERTRLFKYTEALVLKGRLPPDSLQNIDTSSGRIALSSSLIDLARLHLDNWPNNGQVSIYSQEELRETETLAGQLYSSWPASQLAVGEIDDDEMVNRAFTLERHTYVKLREGALFVLKNVTNVDALIPPFVAPQLMRASQVVVSKSVEDAPVSDTNTEMSSEVEVDTETEATSTPVDTASEAPQPSSTPVDDAAEAPGTTPAADSAATPCEVETS